MDRKQTQFEETKRRLDELDFLDFLKYLFAQMKWIIAVVFAAVIITGLYVFLIAEPEYEAEAQVYVSQEASVSTNLAALQAGAYLAADYEYVFQSWEVHEQVIQNLQLPYEMNEFRKMVEVEQPEGTRLLLVKARANHPSEAAQIANEFAVVAGKYISDAMNADTPIVVSEAHPPLKPVQPKKKMALAVASVISCFASVCVLIVVFLADSRIRTEEDLWRFFRREPLAVFSLPDACEVNKRASRLLCANLMHKDTHKRILLVSCRDGEGGRFIAESLGKGLSELGRSCVFLETTEDKRNLHENHGLLEYLRGQCTLEGILQPAKDGGVCRIPFGKDSEDCALLLNSNKLPELFQKLDERFDVILIDGGSLDRDIDALAFAGHCDIVLFVVRRCLTPAKEISTAMRQFERLGVRHVEIVLTGMKNRRSPV